MVTEADTAWMQRAITLAKNGWYTTRENPRVGCVLVKNGKKIGEGWHEFPGGPHAEVSALAQAGLEAAGATCYVTLAPCAHVGKTPPCTEALIHAKVARVFAASFDFNPLVAEKSSRALIQAGIQVEQGLCQEEAMALNPGFFMRMQHKRPFVRLKTAMSLDGCTAMVNGQSQWITGPEARSLVQQLRAQSDAIITGINTVLMDDPSLTVRDEAILANKHFKQPKRVILDTQLRMPLSAKLLSLPGEVLLYTTSQDAEKIAALKNKGAQVYSMPSKQQADPVIARCARNDGIDLNAVLAHLAQLSCNEVLVEAGSILNGAFVQENLVDEWHVFVAPKIMGDNTRALCMLPDLTQLSQAITLEIKHHFQVGEDYCYIVKIKRET